MIIQLNRQKKGKQKQQQKKNEREREKEIGRNKRAIRSFHAKSDSPLNILKSLFDFSSLFIFPHLFIFFLLLLLLLLDSICRPMSFCFLHLIWFCFVCFFQLILLFLSNCFWDFVLTIPIYTADCGIRSGWLSQGSRPWHLRWMPARFVRLKNDTCSTAVTHNSSRPSFYFFVGR